MPDRTPQSLLRRAALGLWFCVIAALGLLEFHRHAFPAGSFEPSLIAWLWLAGSAVLAVLGVAAIYRATSGPAAKNGSGPTDPSGR